LEQFLD